MKKEIFKEKYTGCTLGGIVLIHRKDGWKVEEWKNGKAPLHDHFFWDLGSIVRSPEERSQIYPKLKRFPINHGMIIGTRSEMISSLPYYLLDGIVLL